MIRKVIIGALALFVTAGAVNAQTQFGVKGGLNLSNTTYNSSGNVDKSMRLPNFNAGLVADIGLTDMFSVKTGLEVQGKGTKNRFAQVNDNTYSELTSRPIYLEVPVNFVAKFPVANNVKLYAGAGPYAAVGVAGTNKIDTYINGTRSATLSTDAKKIEWGNDNPLNSSAGDRGQYKRFDAGVNVVGGLEFNNRFGINVQYGMGLINTIPGQTSDVNKHRVLGVSGVLFF